MENKKAVLAALMDCQTLSEAAERAGISRRQLYTYLHTDPEFAKEYQMKQDAKALESLEHAIKSREQAIDVVRSMLDDESTPPGMKLKAAQLILDDYKAAAGRAEQALIRAKTDANPYGILF